MTEKNNSSSVRIFIFSKTVGISLNLQFTVENFSVTK